jgi:hypothetical protein
MVASDAGAVAIAPATGARPRKLLTDATMPPATPSSTATSSENTTVQIGADHASLSGDGGRTRP